MVKRDIWHDGVGLLLFLAVWVMDRILVYLHANTFKLKYMLNTGHVALVLATVSITFECHLSVHEEFHLKTPTKLHSLIPLFTLL